MGLIGKAAGVGGDMNIPEVYFIEFDGVYYKRSLAAPDGFDGSGPFVYEDPADTGSTKIRVDEDLDRELLEGVVTPWMSGVSAQKQNFEFLVSYRREGGSTFSFAEKVTVTLTATDASNRTYTQLETSITGEDVTTGLAEAIYNAMTATHYEGEVNLVAADVPAAPALGNVVNIASGRAAWATMAAVVQSVSDDYDAGRRTLVLGAPEHLSPQDAIELQRVNRRPEGVTGNRAANAAMRRDGTL